MTPPRRVSHSFLEMLRALNEAKVRYLVIGGVAVALHGVDRNARDLDVYPAPDRENLLAAIRALAALGFRPILPVNPEEIADPATRRFWIRKRNLRVFSMIDPLDTLHPIDLMIVERVPFEEAWRRRDRRRVRGVPVPVMSVEDLIVLKRSAGRDQDLLDIKALKRAGSTPPDAPSGRLPTASEKRRPAR